MILGFSMIIGSFFLLHSTCLSGYDLKISNHSPLRRWTPPAFSLMLYGSLLSFQHIFEFLAFYVSVILRINAHLDCRKFFHFLSFFLEKYQ